MSVGQISRCNQWCKCECFQFGWWHQSSGNTGWKSTLQHTHRVVTLVYRQSRITVKASYPAFNMLPKLFFSHKCLLKSDLPLLKVQTIQKVFPPWFIVILSSSLLWDKCWSVHGVFRTCYLGLGKTEKAFWTTWDKCEFPFEMMILHKSLESLFQFS